MKTQETWGLRLLLAVVVLISAAGCGDAKQVDTDVCQREPAHCVHDSGTAPPAPDAGTPDEEAPDAGAPGTPPVGKPADTTPPTLIQSSQSASGGLAGAAVTLSVTARDDESPQLRFTWTVTAGALGVPSSTGNTSQVVWTAPVCIPRGTVASVTVTVTNSSNASVSTTFSLSSFACPAPTVVTGRWHSLALRADGTVWAWGYNAQGQAGDGRPYMMTVPVKALLP